MPPVVPSAAPLPAGSYLENLKKKNDKSSSSSATSSSLELPKPSLAPNASLPQSFNIWFTHREEVPLVTHALDLFHGHDEATRAMPLDRVNPDRAWKTSEIIPFLGHVSLERMECTIDNGDNYSDGSRDGTDVKHPFVRIIVNGSPHQQPICHDGPGGSCPLSKFLKIVEELPGIFGTVKEVCQQKEE
jgi:acid phosphatase